MSKISELVLECQEMAEQNINQTREGMLEVAEKVFKGDSFKVRTTVQEWQKIRDDMWQVF
jgi:hypothetical protein